MAISLRKTMCTGWSLLEGAPLRRAELGLRLAEVNFSSFFVGCTEEMDSEIRGFFLSL